MWGGIDPEDFGEPKAAAADFSSLTLEQKVTAAVMISHRFHKRIGRERNRKKKIVAKDEWFSYLTKQELMMMGDLEANNIFNEEPYRCLSPISRLNQKRYEDMMNLMKAEKQGDEADIKRLEESIQSIRLMKKQLKQNAISRLIKDRASSETKFNNNIQVSSDF